MAANWSDLPLYQEKVIATGAMLLITLLFCYLPYFVARKWRRSNWLMSLLNCVAGGVVLGALLLHMIPEMIQPHDHSHCGDSGEHAHAHEFPWGCFAAGVSFLGLFSIDRLFLTHAHCENDNVEKKEEETKASHLAKDSDCESQASSETELVHRHHHEHNHEHEHGASCSHGHHHHDHGHHHGHKILTHQASFDSSSPLTSIKHEDCHEADVMGGCHMEGIRTSKSRIQAYVFVLALSMHSLLEGLGMSGKNSESVLYRFLVGLFAHKWIEAFALGVTVMSSGIPRVTAFGLITFYTILTPVGIVGGMLADYWSLSSTASSVKSASAGNALLPYIFNGLAAGSFMFVSCIEMIPPEFHKREDTALVKFLAVCLGFMIMAVAATYHSH